MEALLRTILRDAYAEWITEERIQTLWKRIEEEMNRWKRADGPS